MGFLAYQRICWGVPLCSPEKSHRKHVRFCGLRQTAQRCKFLLLISAGISLVGFLIVSLLLYILSARIVKPISDSYEKQRQFITNASHDLKTPITIIDADMDILEMDYDDNEWLQEGVS